MSPGAVNPAKIAFCDRCVNRRSLIWITDDAAVLYQIGRSHLPGRANGLRRDDLALAITWPAPRFCGQRLIGHGRWCWTATIWRADGGPFDHHPHPQPAGAGASGCGLGAGRPVPPGGWSTMAPPRRSQRHWLNGSALRAGCWSTPAAQHRRAISARAGRGAGKYSVSMTMTPWCLATPKQCWLWRWHKPRSPTTIAPAAPSAFCHAPLTPGHFTLEMRSEILPVERRLAGLGGGFRIRRQALPDTGGIARDLVTNEDPDPSVRLIASGAPGWVCDGPGDRCSGTGPPRVARVRSPTAPIRPQAPPVSRQSCSATRRSLPPTHRRVALFCSVC